MPQPRAGQCSEECETDSQCPWGQRCTRTSCGRACMDTPGGEAQETKVLPQEPQLSQQGGHSSVLCPAGRGGACPMPGGGGTCLDLCSLDEECPWGHRCCSNGCGHVCTRVPGGKETDGHRDGASSRASTGHAGCQLTPCMNEGHGPQHHCEARSLCCPIALLPADAFTGRGDLK